MFTLTEFSVLASKHLLITAAEAEEKYSIKTGPLETSWKANN